MWSNLRYMGTLLGMTVKSAASQRGAMVLRGVFSLLSNLIYFPVWYVIFGYTPSIAGWQIHHALMAYGISITCWGIVALLAYGLRTIPQQIDHGELDSYLTLPRPVLLTAALSTSRNSGLGEVVFGVGLLTHVGFHYHVDMSFVPLFIVMGSIVFASGILLFATIGFWVRQFYASAEEIYFNFNLMASRPAPIFSGVFQIIALTVIPVSLMTHVPIQFVENHNVLLLLGAVVGTAAYAVLAIAFFHFGLRYYESGNRFGVRG